MRFQIDLKLDIKFLPCKLVFDFNKWIMHLFLDNSAKLSNLYLHVLFYFQVLNNLLPKFEEQELS